CRPYQASIGASIPDAGTAKSVRERALLIRIVTEQKVLCRIKRGRKTWRNLALDYRPTAARLHRKSDLQFRSFVCCAYWNPLVIGPPKKKHDFIRRGSFGKRAGKREKVKQMLRPLKKNDCR